MDQIGSDSDEGDEQPPPKEVPEGKRVNAIRLLFDAMGKDSNPTAAWHLLKFMEATSLSDYCGGWIRGVAVQPRTYYTRDEVVEYANQAEAVSRREKEGDIRKLEKEIKVILRDSIAKEKQLTEAMSHIEHLKAQIQGGVRNK